jgi:hypothetical protein
MSWNAITSIADLVGSVAVVISLVYLARQVRAGTREMRTNIRDSAFQSLMEWNYAIMSDPELGWIFQTGCRDFHALDEKGRARLVHVMYSFFKLFENVYLHSLDKSVDESVWTHNAPMLLAYASQPGAQHYLAHRQKIFDPRFWAYLQERRPAEVPAGHVVSGLGQPGAVPVPPPKAGDPGST